jgi:hypothetical protein
MVLSVFITIKKLSFFLSINYALLLRRKKIQSSEGILIFGMLLISLLVGYSGRLLTIGKYDLDL